MAPNSILVDFINHPTPSAINPHPTFTVDGLSIFHRNENFFSDIDECATNDHDCDGNADCRNNDGSYTCECKTGWSGDGKSCTGETLNSNTILN